MPIQLSQALKQTLHEWQLDLPPSWLPMLKDVELGFNNCAQNLELEYWEPIFPSRREAVFPGEPKGAHIFSAFDNISPNDVTCIILGQDPYPEPGFATGRAFEAGNIAEWREMNKMFSKSMRVLTQQVCASRTNNTNYARSFDDWPTLLSDIENKIFHFERPNKLVDTWVAQGVLLLNSSLTLSRFKRDVDIHQSHGHGPVWHPFIQTILSHFRDLKKPIVFMAFGDMAIENFRVANINAENMIQRPHPAFAEQTFAQENPFIVCNRHLAANNQNEIKW
ncbi:MAG: uracil-DNA glycosylase [Rhizobiales bacterium]|nr:uracil-DNA glycosylase [Hyphomicrobiales bacterium]NRB12911.1 uracil-DNA glycosylase [Hyphomicrobiales bacterium]